MVAATVLNLSFVLAQLRFIPSHAQWSRSAPEKNSFSLFILRFRVIFTFLINELTAKMRFICVSAVELMCNYVKITCDIETMNRMVSLQRQIERTNLTPMQKK